MQRLRSPACSPRAAAFGGAAALLALAGILAAPGCGSGRSAPVALRAANVEIRVSVQPASPRVGENRLWIELRGADGQPLEGAKLAVAVRMPAMGAMPEMGGAAAVTALGSGRYRADFSLAMPGSWPVEIEASPPAGPVVRAEGSLSVGTPGLRLAAVGGEAAPESARHPGEFRMDAERVQQIGVRSAEVEAAPLETTLRAAGRVTVDETALEDVSLKVRGWVRKLEVAALGDPVHAGQVLFTLYSPELYAAQQELIQALRSQRAARGSSAPERADALVAAARTRLRLWDLAPEEIAQIERAGAPLESLPIRAARGGYVIEKNVVAGGAVEPGQRLYRIAPLDRVWIAADVYESEAGLVAPGQAAEITLPYQPGRRFEGRVAYVYPTVAAGTRTLRLRIELANPELELRPDMYADVALAVDRGARLLVPDSAVLHAGERSFVFLDLGGGRFRPQRVELGLRGGERVEVLSGLAAGDRIVTSGTFLIASESRLHDALEQW